MGTPSMNISYDYKLVNFNVPNYLIKNFDNLVKFKRVSRTSMLVHLMENYLRTEQQKLKEDKIIAEGMLPKLENSFRALKKGVSSVHIGLASMITNTDDNHTTITL